MNLACASCPVRDSAACSVLSDEERDAVASMGRTRTLKRGELLFAAGDEKGACATLVSGALKICGYDHEGNEQILALVHPAGFVGEMFTAFTHHDVVALTDSQLCVFSGGSMEQAVEDYPALSRALLRRSQEDLHQAREMLELTARGSAEMRLASFLLSVASAASDSPCHPSAQFDLPLTRGEIANMLGLTIETVSRKIGQFEKQGMIKRVGKRGIQIVNIGQLRELAGKE